jgi:uncharacterized protein (TIGR01619 family)
MKSNDGSWNFYMCRLNGKPASIFLDLKADRFREDFPELLVVFVQLRQPNPQNGMSTQADYQALIEIEDALDTRLAGLGTEMICRVTTDGQRQFYYCARQQFAADLSQVQAKFPDFAMQQVWRSDPAWKQYYEVLYPGEEDIQCMKNRDVLESLKQHGDKLTAAREICHWSYFPERATRDAFTDQLRAAGFHIKACNDTKTKNPDDQRKFAAVYAREGFVDYASINQITLEVFRLTKRFGGDYDGWETQVVK